MYYQCICYPNGAILIPFDHIDASVEKSDQNIETRTVVARGSGANDGEFGPAFRLSYSGLLERVSVAFGQR